MTPLRRKMRQLFAACVCAASLASSYPCQVDSVLIVDSTLSTLATGIQQVSPNSAVEKFTYGDTASPSTITIGHDCVSGEQIYLGLELRAVFSSEDNGVSYQEVDPSEYSEQKWMGGIDKKTPSLGMYSPVYLDNITGSSDAFDTTLVIDTMNTALLPSASQLGQARYKFFYNLYFETEQGMFAAEKKNTQFEVHYFEDKSADRQCPQLFKQYVVNSNDWGYYHIYCLPEGEESEKTTCSSKYEGPQQLNRLSGLSDPLTPEVVDNLDEEDDIAYFVDIRDDDTDLYGAWEFYITQYGTEVLMCGVIDVVHACVIGTNYFESGKLQQFSFDQTGLEQASAPNYAIFTAESVSCDDSLISYQFIGVRFNEQPFQTNTPIHSYFQQSAQFDNGILYLYIPPAEIEILNEGVYELAYKASIGTYADHFEPDSKVQATFYVQLDFQLLCLNDAFEWTAENFNLPAAERLSDQEFLYTLTLNDVSFAEPAYSKLLDSPFLEADQVCKTLFSYSLGLILTEALDEEGNKMDLGSGYDLAQFTQKEPSGGLATSGPYPLTVDPETNELIFSAVSGKEVAGKYRYALVLLETKDGDLKASNQLQDLKITIVVKEEAAEDDLFEQVVSQIANDLPDQEFIPKQFKLELMLNPIVTKFGVSQAYSTYSLSVDAVDSDAYGHGVQLSNDKKSILLGPFSEDPDLINVVVTVSDGEKSAQILIKLVMIENEVPTDPSLEDAQVIPEHTVVQGEELVIFLKDMVTNARLLVGVRLQNIPEQRSFSSYDLASKLIKLSPSFETQTRSYVVFFLVKDQFSGLMESKTIIVIVTKGTKGELVDGVTTDPTIEKSPFEQISKEKRAEMEQVDEDSIAEYLWIQSTGSDLKEQQKLFNQVLQVKFDQIAELDAQEGELDLQNSEVNRDGEFEILFTEHLLGLTFIDKLDVSFTTEGLVSTLFADEEGPVWQQTQTTKRSDRSGRILLAASKEDAKSFDLQDYLKFELRRGGEDSAPPKDLQFDVVVEKKASSDINLKLVFQNPGQVSTGHQKDLLVCEVNSEPFFSRMENPAKIEKGTQIALYLPRLLLNDQLEQFANSVHQTIETATTIILSSNFLLTLILAASFKAMWSLLNALQVVAFLRYYTLWPAIIDKTLARIFEVITLKFLSDPILQYGKSKFDIFQSRISDQFVLSQGVESTLIIDNLGIYLLAAIAALLFFTLFKLLALCSFLKSSCCMKIRQRMRLYLVYGAPIQYMLHSYIRLLAVFGTFFVVGLSPNFFITGFAGLLFLALMLFPLGVVYWLIKNHGRLNEASFKAKWRIMYNGIKVDSFQALLYNAVFAVRRFDLVVINLVLNSGSPILSTERTHYLEKILLFLSLQTLYVTYIYRVKPHDNPVFNSLEVFNEIALIGFAYSMLIFSGLNWPISENQSKYGKSASLLTIALIITVNQVILVSITLGRIFVAFKACLKGRAARKQKQESPQIGVTLVDQEGQDHKKSHKTDAPAKNEKKDAITVCVPGGKQKQQQESTAVKVIALEPERKLSLEIRISESTTVKPTEIRLSKTTATQKSKSDKVLLGKEIQVARGNLREYSSREQQGQSLDVPQKPHNLGVIQEQKADEEDDFSLNKSQMQLLVATRVALRQDRKEQRVTSARHRKSSSLLSVPNNMRNMPTVQKRHSNQSLSQRNVIDSLRLSHLGNQRSSKPLSAASRSCPKIYVTPPPEDQNDGQKSKGAINFRPAKQTASQLSQNKSQTSGANNHHFD